MKLKLYWLLFILLCTLQTNACKTANDYRYVGKFHEYFFFEDITDIHTVDDAMNYVYETVKYRHDSYIHGKQDYWQLPEETYKLKTGDCEDMCMLLMYILREKLNIESDMVLLITLSYPRRGHAMVRLRHEGYLKYFLDPTWNAYVGMRTVTEYARIAYYIPYEELIFMTYMYHNRAGKYYGD